MKSIPVMTYHANLIRLDVKLALKQKSIFEDLRDFERILTLNARVNW